MWHFISNLQKLKGRFLLLLVLYPSQKCLGTEEKKKRADNLKQVMKKIRAEPFGKEWNQL